MESELVGYYRKQNDKENGLKSVLRALELTESLGQGETVSGATVFVNCATAYRAFEKPSEAIPLYRRAEEIYKKFLQDGDSRFGALYNNMALALADVGDLKGAEQAYFSALSVMEKIDGGEAECAITYINLAHMYDDFEKSELIRDCMEKAYTLLQSDKLVHDGNYAFVIEKCAPSFGYFGDVETYEKLKKEAEEIYARA
jgi:tetratricopeptide (TPR) repeat protein